MTDPASEESAVPSPQEALVAYHRCMEAMLGRLEGLIARGSAARAGEREAAARDILAAFDCALGVHLDDEEEDIFPAVLAAAQSPARHAQAFELVSSLLVEHREMTELWLGLRVALGALGHGLAGPFPEYTAQRFLALCHRHLAREERELDDLLRSVKGERLAAIARSIAARHRETGCCCPRHADPPGT